MVKGIDYLYNRGLTDRELNKFGLAYYDGKAFYGHTTSVLTKQLITFYHTLCKQDSTTNYAAMCADSVLIPIQNTYNEIVSFAIRNLQANAHSKFMGINGYKKSLVLYGLNFAYPEILKQDYVFLVEGYWEVIALHKYNITNVVALCGCSIKDIQISYLQRFTNNFVILLDPDNAGRAASNLLHKKLTELGGNARILNLDHPVDLDEYIQKFTIERFKQLCGIYQIPIQ